MDTSVQELERIIELQDRIQDRKPDTQKEYNLLDNDELYHAVAEPSYKLAKAVAKCEIRRIRQDKEVVAERELTYGIKRDEKNLYKDDMEYYKDIVPLVCLEDVKVTDDLIIMNADRMIRDFLMRTFG